MSCTLCMIAKNEEHTLMRCLESVKGLFDEIVIVDTGSSDNTKKTALEFTDRVYDFEWVYDFSAARNYAFSLANTDYAMWLDADDIIPPQSYEPLKKTLASLEDTQPDIVFMPYCVGFSEDGEITLSFERERIIRLGKGLLFEGEIHEAIPPRGKTARSDAQVWHLGKENRDPNRNIDFFERLVASGKKLSPREMYYYARELSWHDRIPEAKSRYLECIGDPTAWSENRISACCELAELYIRENDLEAAMEYLLKSLSFGAPRADMCCRMGYIFLQKNELETARFWYSLAPERFNQHSVSFIHADYGKYIPYIQLAVIYDRLGDCKSANEFNELAGKFKPSSKHYLQNKAYFEQKLTK